uniref:ATPAO5 n=1 Tax=Arundo donax TaxID=35708 RepID=A0A0A9F2B4_ARUDO
MPLYSSSIGPATRSASTPSPPSATFRTRSGNPSMRSYRRFSFPASAPASRASAYTGLPSMPCTHVAPISTR